jgi:hypothetical protein
MLKEGGSPDKCPHEPYRTTTVKVGVNCITSMISTGNVSDNSSIAIIKRVKRIPMKPAAIAILLLVCVAALAQTPPTTRPAIAPTTRPSQRSAEDMLRQMLQPQNQQVQPLKPIPNEPPPIDTTSGIAAVIPGASTQPTKPDGTPILDRVGRLTRTADGKFLELTLDSDGTDLQDAPMLLLPNHKLQQLEDLVNNSYADVRLRVSGDVTEYRGRNYLLITRWTQVQDITLPLK